jgi:hypothetical protein
MSKNGSADTSPMQASFWRKRGCSNIFSSYQGVLSSI